jgi:exosortase
MTIVRNRLTAFALVVAGFLVLYRQVAAQLVSDWWNDGNASHGFFVIPIALYLAWERRRQLAVAAVEPRISGLFVVLAGFLVLAAGTLGAELFLMRVSAVGAVVGIIAFFYGWRHVRILAFPLAFLLLMIPLPAIVLNKIALPLQFLASRVGESVIQLARVPVLREGNVLVLSNVSLEVAEACSGIRSLLSLVTLAIVLGYVADPRGWVRTALAFAAIPVAVIANGLRVAGTGLAAHRFGPAVAEGAVHEFSGWAVFLVAAILLIGVQRALSWVAPLDLPESTAAVA